MAPSCKRQPSNSSCRMQCCVVSVLPETEQLRATPGNFGVGQCPKLSETATNTSNQLRNRTTHHSASTAGCVCVPLRTH
eukprot:12613882-Alexandrium_andersonii.AAC.1